MVISAVKYRDWIIPIAMTTVLIILSTINFLLFHVLVELFAIVVAILASVVAWKTYDLSKNNYLLYLGCGYFWVSMLDLVHMLTYKGMAIFPILEANPATQFWISARYIEALMLLSAPFFIDREFRKDYVLSLFGILSISIYALVMTGNFPDAFIEGRGLTSFKIFSEYLIITMLSASILYLWNKASLIDQEVFRLIAVATVTTIFAELSFTFYVSVYGLSNIVGHLLKVVSYWLIFKAIVSHTLTNPMFALNKKLTKEIEQHSTAEKSLKESMNQIQDLLDATEQAIYGLDKDGNCTFANRSCAESLGFEDAKQLIGKNMHELIHHTDINGGHYQVEDCPIYRAFSTGELVHIDSEVLWKSDGTSFPAEYWSYPVYRKNRIVGAVVTFNDISDRKETELDRDRLQRELVQAQKMEALGQLTGGIAHDFNNILGIILGYNGLALKVAGDENSKLKSHLEHVHTAGERAKNLVAQMLTFSRSDDVEIAPLSLGPLIKEDLRLLRSTLPTSVEIHTEIEPDVPSVLMDPVQLNQVLMNLCVNAKDAMEGNGTITVRHRWVYDLDRECSSCHEEIKGDWLELSVTDTGCGISQDTLNRIFDPFFTTKDVGKGSGMGLSVVHGIVRKLGGHILVDTIHGEGTTIALYFAPALDLKEQTSEVDNDVNHLGKKQQILVVDDEPELAGLLVNILESSNYKVSAFTNSNEALKAFADNPDNFSLVITDQTMPGMTGIELVKKMRLIRSGVPVIIDSGYSDVLDENEASKLGILYLEKPVDSNKLITAVGKLLN